MRRDRFHGRHESTGRECDWPGCAEPGEFRAPGGQGATFDGPGEYRWFCLDHVRAFNAGYDFFEGMEADEILRAQSPLSGWDRETRAFRPTAHVDFAPRWADYADPLEAISKRAREHVRARQPAQRADGTPVTPDERRAFDTLGLSLDADRSQLRERYAQLLRRYHPDHNGGDRGYETRLREVVEAYQLLRKATVFG